MKHKKTEITEAKTKKKKFYLWAEGKYLDFWTVNHILSGAVIAGTILFFNFSLLLGLVVLFILLIGWEIYESVNKIKEFPTNRTSDVVVGMVGFIAMYILMDSRIFNNIALFLMVVVLFLTLNILGYLSYKKRRGAPLK